MTAMVNSCVVLWQRWSHLHVGNTVYICSQAGEEIIEALCSNSVTYAEKTEFAQEKYKKRKARKYMTSLTLRKPTAWAMAEVS